MPAPRDPVVRALGGLATGAAAGAAVITTGLLVLRSLQGGRVVETQDTGFFVLGASVLVGVITAAASGWLLSSGIEQAWRRGATATLAVFGMLMLSLVAVPADLLAGRPGLALYLMLLLAGSLWSLVHARRSA